MRLLPIGVPQVMIWWRRDEIHPIFLGEEFVAAAKQAGDVVKLVSFSGAFRNCYSALTDLADLVERNTFLAEDVMSNQPNNALEPNRRLARRFAHDNARHRNSRHTLLPSACQPDAWRYSCHRIETKLQRDELDG
jgi:hypothetical protein